MTDPYAFGDGPTLGELELLADVREIAAERDAALDQVRQLKAAVRRLRSELAAARSVALAA
jgi:uncharacterized coiled-coil DUF342 family protein